MADTGQVGIFGGRADARPTDATLLFGRVMFLVGVALVFFAAGAYIGRDLAYGTGLVFEIVAIVMLFAQSFVRPLRVGTFAVAWLYALALLLGIGLGPVLNYYASTDPTVVYQAAAGTALTVVGMGAFGMATSHDLVRWARTLFWGFLAVIVVAWVLVLVGGAGNVLISIAIYLFAAAFLAINFQYLRRSAQSDDVVWIATGIFVNIINIFLALLNIFGNSR